MTGPDVFFVLNRHENGGLYEKRVHGATTYARYWRTILTFYRRAAFVPLRLAETPNDKTRLTTGTNVIGQNHKANAFKHLQVRNIYTCMFMDISEFCSKLFIKRTQRSVNIRSEKHRWLA